MSSVRVRPDEFPCWLIITECMIVCKTTLSWNSHGWSCKAAQIGRLTTIHDLIIHNKWMILSHLQLYYLRGQAWRTAVTLPASHQHPPQLQVIITFLYQDLWDYCLMDSLDNEIFSKFGLGCCVLWTCWYFNAQSNSAISMWSAVRRDLPVKDGWYAMDLSSCSLKGTRNHAASFALVDSKYA